VFHCVERECTYLNPQSILSESRLCLCSKGFLNDLHFTLIAWNVWPKYKYQHREKCIKMDILLDEMKPFLGRMDFVFYICPSLLFVRDPIQVKLGLNRKQILFTTRGSASLKS
jgi:hypothetical protein